MLGLAAVLVGVDQVTKAAAVAQLREDHPVPLLGGLLTLQLIRNSGAAFSLLAGHTWIFGLLATVVLIAMLIYAVPRVRTPWWSIACGLFVAGVAGNLVDRLVRPPGLLQGHVVDFLQLPHWPIFNVADMCITGAAILVIALSLFGKLDWTGQPREESARRERAACRDES